MTHLYSGMNPEKRFFSYLHPATRGTKTNEDVFDRAAKPAEIVEVNRHEFPARRNVMPPHFCFLISGLLISRTSGSFLGNVPEVIIVVVGNLLLRENYIEITGCF